MRVYTDHPQMLQIKPFPILAENQMSVLNSETMHDKTVINNLFRSFIDKLMSVRLFLMK